MKIVIDVPEEEYNTGQLLHYFGCYSDKLDLVIYNGTPLPKGHGDLIDRKELIENGISKGFCDWNDEIKMADTIIEADKGSDSE